MSSTNPNSKTTRRKLVLPVAATAAAAMAGVAVPAYAASRPAPASSVAAPSTAIPSAAIPSAPSAVAKYLGEWNYTQPDFATMANIAVMHPGTFESPQVGAIVYTSPGPGRVVARTDVGCTWTFRADRDALRLDPAAQTCHNPTFDIW